jgi:Rieske Fe-S protein
MGAMLDRMKQVPGAMMHFIGDRLSRPEAMDVSEIDYGEGALVMIDGRKLAVYRDENNTLHAMSPVCRHMKCIVDWNAQDKTWDCPCHGSRYDAMGHVVQGPARKGLVHQDINP